MTERCPDVVVVGAGIVGSSIAFHSSALGLKVLVLEARDIGSGASAACDGYVSLQTKSPGPHLELARESIARVRRLHADGVLDAHYEDCGVMIVIGSDEEWEPMKHHVAELAGADVKVEFLDPQQAMECEPILRDGQFSGASVCAADGSIDPLALNLEYARLARLHGAEFRFHCPVRRLVCQNGRITGVETANGTVSCDTVVVAAGTALGDLAATGGAPVTMKPIRGQIMVSESLPRIVHHAMLDSRYIALKHAPELAVQTGPIGFGVEQTPHGNLLIGNTREPGFAERNTTEALQGIAEYAIRIAPALAGIHIIRSFAGVRPHGPDPLPFFGPVPHVGGLYLAGGMGGDGITLSAIVGHKLSQMLTGSMPDDTISPFLPERFFS